MELDSMCNEFITIMNQHPNKNREHLYINGTQCIFTGMRPAQIYSVEDIPSSMNTTVRSTARIHLEQGIDWTSGTDSIIEGPIADEDQTWTSKNTGARLNDMQSAAMQSWDFGKDQKKRWLTSREEIKSTDRDRLLYEKEPEAKYLELALDSGQLTASLPQERMSNVCLRLMDNIPNGGDTAAFQFLYAITEQMFEEYTWTALSLCIPKLMSILNTLSSRTFAQLIHVLSLTLGDNTFSDYDAKVVKCVLGALAKASYDFQACFKWHVKHYMITGIDIQIGLDFITNVYRCNLPFDIATMLRQIIEQFLCVEPVLTSIVKFSFQQQFERVQLELDVQRKETAFEHKDAVFLDQKTEEREDILKKFLHNLYMMHQTCLRMTVYDTFRSLQHDIVLGESVLLPAIHSVNKTTLTPCAVDMVAVYEYTGSYCGMNINDYAGRLIILVPTDFQIEQWQVSDELPVVGTLIQSCSSFKVHCDGEDLERVHQLCSYKLIIKHQGALLDGSCNLIITPVLAIPILSTLDWLHYCFTHVESYYPTPSALTTLGSIHDRGCGYMPNSLGLCIENSDIPDHLRGIDLDVSCILERPYHGFKTNIEHCIWPQLQEKHADLPEDQRPSVYALSPSQITAIHSALSHRISMITGPPGTGKTFLCGKILQLMYQAFKSKFSQQTILVITDTLDSLRSTLSEIPDVEDIAWFGNEKGPPFLPGRNVLSLSIPNQGNSCLCDDYKKHTADIVLWIAKLDALTKHRQQAVIDRKPGFLLDLMPPTYRSAILSEARIDSLDKPTILAICDAWLNGKAQYEPPLDMTTATTLTPVSPSYDTVYSMGMHTWSHPIISLDEFKYLQYESKKLHFAVIPLSCEREWPFQSDKIGIADHVRSCLLSVWSQINAEGLWSLDRDDRENVYSQILTVYDSIICKELHHIYDLLDESLSRLNGVRHMLWMNTCNFTRVVGMTAEFAFANQSFLHKLVPQVVLCDSSSQLSTDSLASVALLPGTEQVILFGNEREVQYQIRMEPFAQFWQELGINTLRLLEEWRMDQRLLDLWCIQTGQSSAPLFVCGKSGNVRGIKENVLYIQLQDATWEEASQFTANMAHYILQQCYQACDIAVLSCDPVIRERLSTLCKTVANSSSMSTPMRKVKIVSPSSCTEEVSIVIAVFDGSWSKRDVADAISRARFGLYLIECGNAVPEFDLKKTLRDQGALTSGVQVQCQSHPTETICLTDYRMFELVPNGGCLQKCMKLLKCGHACPEACHMYGHSLINCNRSCVRTLSCGHDCPGTCSKCFNHGCPPCEVPVILKLPCGHEMDAQCSGQDKIQSLESTCLEIIEVSLECGHVMKTICSKQHLPLLCNEIVKKELACGHSVKGSCHAETVCDQMCSQSLECGHPCTNLCRVDHSHSRSLCKHECPKMLLCGHRCARGCAKPDSHTDRCMEKCMAACPHGFVCDNVCWKPCTKCMESCPNKCEHLECTRRCSEICDRPPCNKPCSKELPCGHRCRGVCGEPCTICTMCHADGRCSISLVTFSELEKEDLLYTLPDCGCTFTLQGLDSYFEVEMTNVKLWACPSCLKPVSRTFRYNQQIKKQLNIINSIKEQQELIRQKISTEEKIDIINAMNDELQIGVHDLVGGRWFVCQNEHPYFIGECGGATETGKCPHCHELIGGMNHRVVDTNRFYGEFDGIDSPAWPGQPGEDRDGRSEKVPK
ncbi:hypothetical protein DM01DRAFT_1084351 [Hesseltinella vesiculosa]|uniref:RZ-type domain-containing protein n=1 Tax=Hesseltinella vesiculosa TaxID=101127 RepID=A0A1X2GDB6_9FUNG|nr:hypothetical protein DM01DRAFT_1084351 [Hesseltinella vesiculosa]